MKQRVAGYEGEAGGIGGCPAPAQGERSGDIDEAGTVTGPRGEVVPGVNRHGSSPSSTSTSSSAASSSGLPRSSAVNKADLSKLISLASRGGAEEAGRILQ